MAPYGRVYEPQEEFDLIERLRLYNCEWFKRPEVAMSELAQTVRDNMPLLDTYSGNVFQDEIVQKMHDFYDPLNDCFSRLNKKDQVKDPATRRDVLKVMTRMLEDDEELDETIDSMYEAAAATYLLAVQTKVARALLRNPERYAAKCETNDGSHVPFLNERSVREMQLFITNAVVPRGVEAPRRRSRQLGNELQDLDAVPEIHRTQGDARRQAGRRGGRRAATSTSTTQESQLLHRPRRRSGRRPRNYEDDEEFQIDDEHEDTEDSEDENIPIILGIRKRQAVSVPGKDSNVEHGRRPTGKQVSMKKGLAAMRTRQTSMTLMYSEDECSNDSAPPAKKDRKGNSDKGQKSDAARSTQKSVNTKPGNVPPKDQEDFLDGGSASSEASPAAPRGRSRDKKNKAGQNDGESCSPTKVKIKHRKKRAEDPPLNSDEDYSDLSPPAPKKRPKHKKDKAGKRDAENSSQTKVQITLGKERDNDQDAEQNSDPAPAAPVKGLKDKKRKAGKRDAEQSTETKGKAKPGKSLPKEQHAILVSVKDTADAPPSSPKKGTKDKKDKREKIKGNIKPGKPKQKNLLDLLVEHGTK